MKVVQINTVCGRGSTGKICVGISEMLSEHNIENQILYSQYQSNYPCGIRCTEPFLKLQALKSRILGNYGFNSSISTKKIICKLEKFKPDIVHLHNLHGHNCNIAVLMKYFRDNKIKVVWTFHDCWAFTGYCPHFTMVGCDKWKSGCGNCVQLKSYSWFFDRSKELYNRKREILLGVDLTIVTPSRWLAALVRDSFFKDYPIRIINNGIDLTIFTKRKSNFRDRYGVKDKFIVLGVADKWGKRKGLDIFIELANRLPIDKYQIILVGTDKTVDKILPDSILSIHRTQNQKELAEIYTVADVFVNPTREENYPTVNMESIACGTPVITFNTGGSPESIIDGKSGIIVECGNVDVIESGIISICEKRVLSSFDCISRSKDFDHSICYQEYLRLFCDVCRRG